MTLFIRFSIFSKLFRVNSCTNVLYYRPRLLSTLPVPHEWFSCTNKVICDHFSQIFQNMNFCRENVVRNLVQKEMQNILQTFEPDNLTILEIKRLYQNSANFRGLSTLLMCLTENESILTPSQQMQIAQKKLTLACLSELIHLAVQIHGISRNSAKPPQDTRDIHNKLVTIIGDLVHAKIMADLHALSNAEIVFMYSKMLQNEIEENYPEEGGQQEQDKAFQLHNSSQSFATSLGYSYKSAIMLSDLSNEIKFESTKNAAFKFGFYLALYLKARQALRTNANGIRNILIVYQENAIVNLKQLPLRGDAKKCFERLFLE